MSLIKSCFSIIDLYLKRQQHILTVFKRVLGNTQLVHEFQLSISMTLFLELMQISYSIFIH